MNAFPLRVIIAVEQAGTSEPAKQLADTFAIVNSELKLSQLADTVLTEFQLPHPEQKPRGKLIVSEL